MSNIYFPNYQSEIISRFFPEDWSSGVDFSSVGTLQTREIGLINITDDFILTANYFAVHLPNAVAFIDKKKTGIWLRVTYPGNAINCYLGVGQFNAKQNWKSFVATYLSTYQAEQNGDDGFIIFGHSFDWAVNFELRPDKGVLSAEVFYN